MSEQKAVTMKLTADELSAIESILSERMAAAEQYAVAMQAYHDANGAVRAAREREAIAEDRFREAIDAIVVARTSDAAKGSDGE